MHVVFSSEVDFFLKRITQFNKNLLNDNYANGVIPSIFGQSLIHGGQLLKSYLLAIWPVTYLISLSLSFSIKCNLFHELLLATV